MEGRQGTVLCLLKPLCLLDFREFRAESRDTFGTIDNYDMAQSSRYTLHSRKLHRLFQRYEDWFGSIYLQRFVNI